MPKEIEEIIEAIKVLSQEQSKLMKYLRSVQDKYLPKQDPQLNRPLSAKENLLGVPMREEANLRDVMNMMDISIQAMMMVEVSIRNLQPLFEALKNDFEKGDLSYLTEETLDHISTWVNQLNDNWEILKKQEESSKWRDFFSLSPNKPYVKQYPQLQSKIDKLVKNWTVIEETRKKALKKEKKGEDAHRSRKP